MSPLNPPLNKQDFLNSSWQDIVEKCDISRGWRDYSAAFSQKAHDSQNNGNLREQEVFELLKRISFPVIPANGEKDRPLNSFESITKEQLNFLIEIVPEISDSKFSELKARITDFLWIKKYPQNNPRQMAQLAIDAYLKSAKILEDPKEWLDCLKRTERAFHLAFEIKDQSKIDEVIRHIESVLDYYNGEDSLWLSAKLMYLLLEKKLGDTIKYATLAGKIAQSAESSSDWDRAREHWKIKAKWHKQEKNKQKEFAALILAAETYVKESEQALKEESPSYLRASHFMEKAYVAFRDIPDQTAKLRAEQCHKTLLEYQEKSQKELVSMRVEYDFTQEVQYAKESIQGKEFQEAIFTLATLVPLEKVIDLRATTEQSLKDDPLASIFPVRMMNTQGKTVATDNGANNSEDSIKFKMNQDSSLKYKVYAEILIEPARDQITLEHEINEINIEDLLFLVKDNPFVPSGREYLFAKGLYAGLIGDFFTSTHLLIPQIENSVRHLLWQKGFIPSAYKNGIQNEHDLNKTLYRPEIKTIFDEDTLFTLKCLLVEHSGCNLRNRMAHGLIDDREFQPGVMSYLWWLTLRLCCLPMLNYQEKIEKSNSLLKFAGMFEDDPSFDDFVEAMADNRQQLEIEMANAEDEEIPVS
jgi:hypothetical protein